ncbi:MAG: CD1871A family CXXC motif-containing protein [Proteobacteria bacterium]|nr:CD1871A family CXXC motif-containing protein [Pseudomonadota bacterium]
MRFIRAYISEIVLLAAVTCLLGGMYLQEPIMVFDQAIRICLACIGIG